MMTNGHNDIWGDIYDTNSELKHKDVKNAMSVRNMGGSDFTGS